MYSTEVSSPIGRERVCTDPLGTLLYALYLSITKEEKKKSNKKKTKKKKKKKRERDGMGWDGVRLFGRYGYSTEYSVEYSTMLYIL